MVIQDQEQKHVTGHAGSGNMNLDDLSIGANKYDKPSYDVPTDLIVFMRDDPMFYRKEYYPTMCGCQNCYNNGDKDKSMKLLMPMIDKAVSGYTKKYDLPYEENDLVPMDERKEIAQRIYEEEVNHFKEGEY